MSESTTEDRREAISYYLTINTARFLERAKSEVARLTLPCLVWYLASISDHLTSQEHEGNILLERSRGFPPFQ